MIISHKHKFVYVAIPRTGSKSMILWLKNRFKASAYGFHHTWKVPPRCRDYLIFTIVRNPYERSMSSWYHVPYGRPNKKPANISTYCQVMKEHAKLSDGTVKRKGMQVPEGNMNQAAWINRANVNLVLYHERLPDCLADLPFASLSDIEKFPRKKELGKKPEGCFFDIFSEEDQEQALWDYAEDDFPLLGYHRHDSTLPENMGRSRIIV